MPAIAVAPAPEPEEGYLDQTAKKGNATEKSSSANATNRTENGKAKEHTPQPPPQPELAVDNSTKKAQDEATKSNKEVTKISNGPESPTNGTQTMNGHNAKPTSSKDQDDSNENYSALIGAIIGTAAALIILIAVIVWAWRRHRRLARVSDGSLKSPADTLADHPGKSLKTPDTAGNETTYGQRGFQSVGTRTFGTASTLATALSPSSDRRGTLTMHHVTSASSHAFSDEGSTSGTSCSIPTAEAAGVAAALPQEVTLLEQLGSGAFGTVYRGEWGGRAVAVKVLQTSCSNSSKELNSFRQEVAVLSRLRHPNIITFYAACTVPPNICIIEELAEGGSLHAALHGVRGARRCAALPMRQLLDIAEDIARAMCYLHPRIVHRDLKSLNVLLDANGSAKVCDFGIAKFKDRTFVSTANGQAGTPSYMAPELFDGGSVTEKVDCYAFGILLWEMLTGKVPWGDVPSPMQIIYYVGVLGQRPSIPSSAPPLLRDLMVSCWAEDPASRPPFTLILSKLKDLRVFFERNNQMEEVFGGNSHPIRDDLEEQETSTEEEHLHHTVVESGTESPISNEEVGVEATASSTFDMVAMNSLASSLTNG